MLSSLLLAAFWLGLTGGASHCVAMCGLVPLTLTGAPVGILVRVEHQSSARNQGRRRLWVFLTGRLLAYGLLGMLAAALMQLLGWFSISAAVLRPLWSMVHALGFAWGLFLLMFARQPRWVVQQGHHLVTRLQQLLARYDLRAAWLSGMVLALLPCGLLYTAIGMAVLSNTFWQGGLVMLTFALGSSVALAAVGLAGQQMVRWRLQRHERLFTRLAGLALMLLAAWAMYMALFKMQAPWC